MEFKGLTCPRCCGNSTAGERRCTLCLGSGTYLVTPSVWAAKHMISEAEASADIETLMTTGRYRWRNVGRREEIWR